MFDIKRLALSLLIVFSVNNSFCSSSESKEVLEKYKELVKQICVKEDRSTARAVGIRIAKEIPAAVLLVLFFADQPLANARLLRYFYANYSKIKENFKVIEESVNKQAYGGYGDPAMEPIMREWRKGDECRNLEKKFEKTNKVGLGVAFFAYIILRLILDFRKNGNFVNLDKSLEAALKNDNLKSKYKKQIAKLVEEKLGTKIAAGAGMAVGDWVFALYVVAISTLLANLTFDPILFDSFGKKGVNIGTAVAAVASIVGVTLLTLRQKSVYKNILNQIEALK